MTKRIKESSGGRGDNPFLPTLGPEEVKILNHPGSSKLESLEPGKPVADILHEILSGLRKKIIEIKNLPDKDPHKDEGEQCARCRELGNACETHGPDLRDFQRKFERVAFGLNHIKNCRGCRSVPAVQVCETHKPIFEEMKGYKL